MLSIQDLQLYSKENPPLKTLGRNEEINKSYIKFNSDKKNKEQFIKTINECLLKQDYYFHLNHFPYNIEPHIEHLLLWWRKDINIDKLIISKFNNKVITYWINLPDNNSITDIKHAHIFVIK
jgi:hypothetical protein